MDLLSDKGVIKLGVECCILFENFVLLQRRSITSKYFPGMLCFPGGNVDFGENIKQAIVREVTEECGVVLDFNNVDLVMNTMNFHKDKEMIWVVNAFRAVLNSKPDIKSSDEGSCDWYDISKLRHDELVPPLREYFDIMCSESNRVKCTFGVFENGKLVSKVIN